MTYFDDAYGESTIAIGVYNITGMIGRPVDFIELFDRLKNDFGYSELTEDLLDRAIIGLLDRGFILKRGDLFYGIDPRRRMVVERYRDDEIIDEETGKVLGGWAGWKLRDNKRGLVPIGEVIQ